MMKPLAIITSETEQFDAKQSTETLHKSTKLFNSMMIDVNVEAMALRLIEFDRLKDIDDQISNENRMDAFYSQQQRNEMK